MLQHTEDSIECCLKGGSGNLVAALGQRDMLESTGSELQWLEVDLLQQLVQVRVGITQVEHTHYERLYHRQDTTS